MTRRVRVLRAHERDPSVHGRRRPCLAGVRRWPSSLPRCRSRAAAAPARTGDGRLRVVTTVAPITSIAASVGGEHVEITGIVPEGTNSHTFEPRPSVAELLAEADVLYLNGLRLEEPTAELAEDVLPTAPPRRARRPRDRPRPSTLYDFSFPRTGGKPNPHLWTDPTLALQYAEIVRDDLSARDPEQRRRLRGELCRVRGAWSTARRGHARVVRDDPAGRRKLLTYHDAYAYFARSYGWEVIGAIQVADFGEPTPREVAGLIEQVREEGVPAIFGSEVFPSPVLEQIGREAGVRYVDVLRDDDLPGEPGDAEHSWLGLMRFDYATITEALGGDASALRGAGHRAPGARPGAVPAMTPAATSSWSAWSGSPAATAADPVLEDVDLGVAAGGFVGVVGPSGSRQDLAAAGRCSARSRPRAGTVSRRAGLRIGYVPQVETVDWSFPVTVAECVLMAPPGRPLAAMAEPGRSAPTWPMRSAGSAWRPGRPPHPRAVGRPAAARLPRPGAAAAGPTCCSSTSRPPASTCGCATRCCTCSTTSTRRDWRSCSPPTT